MTGGAWDVYGMPMITPQGRTFDQMAKEYAAKIAPQTDKQKTDARTVNEAIKATAKRRRPYE